MLDHPSVHSQVALRTWQTLTSQGCGPLHTYRLTNIASILDTPACSLLRAPSRGGEHAVAMTRANLECIRGWTLDGTDFIAASRLPVFFIATIVAWGHARSRPRLHAGDDVARSRPIACGVTRAPLAPFRCTRVHVACPLLNARCMGALHSLRRVAIPLSSCDTFATRQGAS